ncbi:3-phosphoserine/phosphohydroxythreonine transaminase [Wielerella bovis]|uniref:3-phosphoserine/phosphohydroxythreonine transaminase n=1 Tax=Wielerella bovis TaxID=2917790 RepID=UPI00201987E1|nr:3-phosphoserine/phosphohydroxythreonine transaminase [Wielerella bovis]MCG7656855.1 3-phosphoserine/phosphohydroxythreonine transaminase [Wielerella bovis]MCG7659079.1 3-phosphoserine/phosphohydroxythreonine transaminase [Wielerella bovis]ULJ61277.1 3-phosphoserine/phosphohydroxythreonine transaminase [Wielerella bovis]
MRPYNFSAGPAVLPESVLRTAQQDMLDYNGTGFSVMEMSHRSDMFHSILYHAEQDLRQLLAIPSNYKVLFLQGGASAHFTQIALNFANGFKRIDSVVTGNWSGIAHSQMGKLSDVKVHLAAHGGDLYHYNDLPPASQWDISPDSAFVHYVINETVHGLQYRDIPQLGKDAPPVICDMSSEILSRRINVADFGVIYAGAQKNVGPSGATIVIIREDLLGRCSERVPNVWNYQKHIEKDGMYNTPATYPIYMAGLVFRWLQTQGGVAQMEKINTLKAQTLYDAIDGSGGFYRNPIQPQARSYMNVIFTTGDKTLDERFIEQAAVRGLMFLRGYPVLGGMRASIYNAMPLAGVEALVAFMAGFQRRYG